MVKLLTEDQPQRQLQGLDSDWKLTKQKTVLSRTITLPDFMTAFTLVARIAVRAEVQQHHPDIELGYGRVKVSMTTHDKGGLTKKDFQLAAAVDDVLASVASGDKSS